MIQKLKYDDNIKPQISEILQLLGFSDESIQNIVNNGEGYFLEKNKKWFYLIRLVVCIYTKK